LTLDSLQLLHTDDTSCCKDKGIIDYHPFINERRAA